MTSQGLVERVRAVGYGRAYDAVVGGFPPFERLLAEVVSLVAGARPPDQPGPTWVLDVGCGTGTVAFSLARAGCAVVGLDPVAPLVDVAERRRRRRGIPGVSFLPLDVAQDPVPGAGGYDVVISMHSLYWHPDPEGLLAGCRRALRPGGHALFLTYERPASVGRTFAEIRREEGLLPALSALRWLAPTALFDLGRGPRLRFLSEAAFHGHLAGAGFEVLDARRTFLAGISLLAWARVPAV